MSIVINSSVMSSFIISFCSSVNFIVFLIWILPILFQKVLKCYAFAVFQFLHKSFYGYGTSFKTS